MERTFDPNDPGEIAAKDQIFSMLSTNAGCLNMLAAVSKAKLRDLVSEGMYLTELQFMCQIVLTMIEERKEEDDTLCWPPGGESFPCSPGWKFLHGLIRKSEDTLDPEESSVMAASIFRRLVEEYLVDMTHQSDDNPMRQIGSLGKALKTEIKMMEKQESKATEDVIVGLKDWLWLMGNPEQLEMLQKRLEYLAREDLTESVQLAPLHDMQMEIRKLREEEEDA